MFLSGCLSRIAYPIGKKYGNSKSNHSAIFKYITHFFSWNFAIIVATDSPSLLGFLGPGHAPLGHTPPLCTSSPLSPLHTLARSPCPSLPPWYEPPQCGGPRGKAARAADQLARPWEPPKAAFQVLKALNKCWSPRAMGAFCVTPFIGELKF